MNKKCAQLQTCRDADGALLRHPRETHGRGLAKKRLCGIWKENNFPINRVSQKKGGLAIAAVFVLLPS